MKNKNNFNPKLSQVFLKQNAADRLVRIANFENNDSILDIGVGSGNIIKALLKLDLDLKIEGYEVDKSLGFELLKAFQNFPNVSISNTDILKIKRNFSNYKVFSNIPFNISSNLLRKIFLFKPSMAPKESYLIVDKRFAEMICGYPKHNLKSLSLYPFFRTKIIKNLNRFDFEPYQKLDIALIVIRKLPKFLIPEERAIEYYEFVFRSIRDKRSSSKFRDKKGNYLPKFLISKFLST